MEKTIRATFSVETNTVNVNLPKSWRELSQAELLAVHRSFATAQGEDVRFLLFRKLADFHVTSFPPILGKYRCIVYYETPDHKTSRAVFMLDGADIAGWMDELNWVYDPGDVPVRLETVAKRGALNAKLYDVPFDTYLRIENYYQGFLQSQSEKPLIELYNIMYPYGKKAKWKFLDGMEASNILVWVAQIKNMFAKQFPNLFKPQAKGSGTPNMLEIMNNEIRILTGGDVTKEQEVREVECWRALTELDFKAKEAEEFRRQMAKKH